MSEHPALMTPSRVLQLQPHAGQKITLKFSGSEDFELQTSFVIDDTAINVS
jgi:hypothetical protein